MKHIFSLLLTILLCFALVSCASTAAEITEGPFVELEATEKGAVVEAAEETVLVEETTAEVLVEEPAEEEYSVICRIQSGSETGFNSLAEAINFVQRGEIAEIIVCNDLDLTELILIDDKEIRIIDNGTAVTLTDAISGVTYTEYNGKDVACPFRVINTGKLILSGTEAGGLTFKGAGPDAETTLRIMFYIGTGYKNPDIEISGALEFNAGVTVTNIYSTIFGGMVRGYGALTINGGSFVDNYVKGNGIFTVYSETVINDCYIANNDAPNLGVFQVTTATANLIVNGGLYENNTSSKKAAVFNINSKSSFTLNGGTFRNNTVYDEGNGGAINILSKSTINGGTFENNAPCDIFIADAGVTVEMADNLAANILKTN